MDRAQEMAYTVVAGLLDAGPEPEDCSTWNEYKDRVLWHMAEQGIEPSMVLVEATAELALQRWTDFFEAHRAEPLGPDTSITYEHAQDFEALHGGADGFALFACTVNGEQTCAIVQLQQCADGKGSIDAFPLFVAVTPGMDLRDLEGDPAHTDDD